MAAATGAYLSYDPTSNREDLTDDIYNIDPMDTPVFSGIPDVDAENTNHEWQTEALAAGTNANANLEGEDFIGQASIPTVRVRNICQIPKKEPVVSRTQMSINHAGINDMMDHQIFKRMQEIKRDVEHSITANKGLVVGNSTTARVMRGLGSWLSTNVNTVGANAVSETAARTDGATRALTKTFITDVEKQIYDSGGNAGLLSVSSTNKQVVAGIQGRADAREMVDKDTIHDNVDVFAGNFLRLNVVANRNQDRVRDAFMLQLDLLATAYLDRISSEPIPKQGDNVKALVVGELTLEVRNEAAHGGIFDLVG